jgi:hypothetical protein
VIHDRVCGADDNRAFVAGRRNYVVALKRGKRQVMRAFQIVKQPQKLVMAGRGELRGLRAMMLSAVSGAGCELDGILTLAILSSEPVAKKNNIAGNIFFF